MNDRFTDPRHIKWAKAVKSRDDYTCQICGAQGTYLNSHHVYSFDEHVERRFDVENGITLCRYHHEIFHEIYGAGNNDEFQFDEFKRLTKMLQKVAENR